MYKGSIVSYVSHGNQQKQAIMVLKNPNPGTIWQPTPVETMPGLTQYLKCENISIYKWFTYNHSTPANYLNNLFSSEYSQFGMKLNLTHVHWPQLFVV